MQSFIKGSRTLAPATKKSRESLIQCRAIDNAVSTSIHLMKSSPWPSPQSPVLGQHKAHDNLNTLSLQGLGGVMASRVTTQWHIDSRNWVNNASKSLIELCFVINSQNGPLRRRPLTLWSSPRAGVRHVIACPSIHANVPSQPLNGHCHPIYLLALALLDRV